ncbi:MAG: hypothetical protein KDA85_03380, partial [Planctomycetaceae bacterium]|nr:hypothetical protein [Planctomycetaceae bacterium]
MFHLLARDRWHEIAGQVSTNLLDDQVLAVTHWSPEPYELLDDLHRLEPLSPENLQPNFKVLQDSRNGPAGIYVRVHTARSASAHELLSSLAEGCGFSIQYSPIAARQFADRNCVIHVDDRSLSLLFDGLTIPFGNLWRWRGSQIEIVTGREIDPDEQLQFQRESAERMLRAALLTFPEARQLGHSRLALGALLFHNGMAADAAHLFRVQLEAEPRSVLESPAAFNLGKSLLSLREPSAALDAFTMSLDSSVSPQDLRVSAYLYTGRLQMALGREQAAILTLMRGLAVAEQTALEGDAALMLSAAYLLNNNPQGANAVLLERTRELTASHLRNAAAFAASLARYRAAVLADRKQREGTTLVASIAGFHPEQEFGTQWSFLLADACFDLGLISSAEESYLTTIRALPECPLRDQAILKLAHLYRAEDRLDEANGLLTQLSPESTPP